MSPPTAVVEHSVAGRTRLRLALLRGQLPRLDALAAALAGAPGVIGVESRPLTGSLVIQHAEGFQPIAEHAVARGLFVLSAIPTQSPSAPSSAKGSPLSLPQSPFDLALMLLLLGMAGVQVYRGQLLAPASTLLWYALSLAPRRT